MAGEVVRLVISGAPAIAGRTMASKLAWARKHAESMRRVVMLEPRGHAGLQGALLTEPANANSHAGVLFMNAAGFSVFSGDGIIACATLAIENNLIQAPSETLIFDTPAGTVTARPHIAGTRVDVVSLTSVPAFVFHAALPVQAGGRRARVDIAFGGEFYAIVDSESVGVPVDPSHAHQLVRLAAEIQEDIESSRKITHPSDPMLTGIQGVIFTAPPRGTADLRTATVLDGGVLRRSPGLASTGALLAVLDAMGLVSAEQVFTNEGILGTTLSARISSRYTTDEVPFVVPVMEASAWTTGRHELVVESHDKLEPFRFGGEG